MPWYGTNAVTFWFLRYCTELYFTSSLFQGSRTDDGSRAQKRCADRASFSPKDGTSMGSRGYLNSVTYGTVPEPSKRVHTMLVY